MSTWKPILCLDFDGVCHSYTSGWQGATVIPDPPVPGMWPFLEGAVQAFQVHIYSSRSHEGGGIAAMLRWFRQHAVSQDQHDIVEQWLVFPLQKPAAMVTLDDRALTFTGIWPTVEALLAFEPWTQHRPPPYERPSEGSG